MHERIIRSFRPKERNCDDGEIYSNSGCGSRENVTIRESDIKFAQRAGHASIFATTFNMGKSEIPRNLGSWIPPNHDIYAIAVQQCIDVGSLRKDVQHYLESVNCMCFAAFVAEFKTNMSFGSKACFTAQMVFVRKAEVDAGLFSIPSGALELTGTATYTLSTKLSRGAVGIPIRYLNLSMAIVSCSLSSRYKRRNREASELIHNLRMEVDDVGIDFPLLYHHTLLLGALNYQLAADDCHVFGMIHEAKVAEDLKLQADASLQQWLAEDQCHPHGVVNYPSSLDECDLKVTHTRSDDGVDFSFLDTPTGNYMSKSFGSHRIRGGNSYGRKFLDYILPCDSFHDDDAEITLNRLIELAQTRHSKSRQCWQNILSYDELCCAMLKCEIFYGFTEADINFLPTYRRTRNCGSRGSNLANRETIEKSYQAKTSKGYTNAPSYSDRILIHSLPELKDAIKSKGYWSCEEITSSDHKPVCSVIEVEVDRLFQRDPFGGNSAGVKQQYGVRSYTIHLSHLRSHIWRSRLALETPTSPYRTMTDSNGSLQQFDSEFSDNSSPTPGNVTIMLNGEDPNRQNAKLCAAKYETQSISTNNDQEDMQQLPPVVITTVFPLPSEDVFSSERKLHEVADSVAGGFSGRASDEKSRRSNSMTTSWTEAIKYGIKQSAVMKLEQGTAHVAVRVLDENGYGGHGVLCIKESYCDLKEPQLFDIALSFGGQHVGSLYGQVTVNTA